jgi:hypothetical protein
MSKQSDSIKRGLSGPSIISCDGKVKFANFSLADAVIKRAQTKERNGRSAYKCAHCGQWHIGTDNGKVSKKKAQDFSKRKAAFV